MFSKKVNVMFLIYLIGSPIVMNMVSSIPVKKNGRTNSSGKNYMEVRKRRAVPFARIASTAGKYAGWAIAMAAAGIVTTSADHMIREYIIKTNAGKKVARKRIDCTTNNFGCVQNICWTNCGPRVDYTDWCFTTRNLTENVYDLAKCETDLDCNPCMSCAGSCMFDIDPSANINGSPIATNSTTITPEV